MARGNKDEPAHCFGLARLSDGFNVCIIYQNVCTMLEHIPSTRRGRWLVELAMLSGLHTREDT